MFLASIQRLLGSKKAVVVCLAILVAGVLAGMGKVGAPEFLAFMKWLTITFVAGTALEDASEKFSLPAPVRKPLDAEPPVTTIEK